METIIAKNGTRVQKKSLRPFKSTFQINTVKGVTVNPFSGQQAYLFEEDDSLVDIFRCEPVVIGLLKNPSL